MSYVIPFQNNTECLRQKLLIIKFRIHNKGKIPMQRKQRFSHTSHDHTVCRSIVLFSSLLWVCLPTTLVDTGSCHGPTITDREQQLSFDTVSYFKWSLQTAAVACWYGCAQRSASAPSGDPRDIYVWKVDCTALLACAPGREICLHSPDPCHFQISTWPQRPS